MQQYINNVQDRLGNAITGASVNATGLPDGLSIIASGRTTQNDGGGGVFTYNVTGHKDSATTTPFSSIPYRCAYSLTGANPIEQAYVYLKTLPEFSGAADI